MIKEAIGTGSSIEEAKEQALQLLGASEDAAVEYEILDYQQKKTFGLFGGKPARVRAYIEGSRADECAEYIKNLIEKMGITSVEVTVKETEDGAEFNIDGDDIGSIIGRRGETLDAIQYLTSLAVNRKEGDYFRVLINVGNYREKREVTLKALAKKIANNALRTGRSTTLEPMSPYERRIIHTAVQEIEGATSWSVGEEPNRVVIIGSEKKGGFNQRRRGGKGGNRGGRYGKDFADRKENAPVQQSREPKVLDDSDIPLYGRIDV